MSTGALAATRARLGWLGRPGVLDTLMVLAITLFTGILSGSQRWTGLDTPDSSFYASLALNGDEVTDRAPETSYYWTRLGYIVPVRVLTGLLGPFAGFAAYRMILILIIVAAAYAALRRFTGIPAVAAITILISLNTVVLGYLGNTYLTGTVLAGTFGLIACGVHGTVRGRAWPTAAVAGALLGWLLMVNPYGALLGGVVWLTLALRPLQPRVVAVRLGTAALAAVVTFGTYLLIGRSVFPRMDWLATYLEWNGRLNYSDYASADAVWLHDISMLVPAGALIVVLIVWVRRRDDLAAQTAALIVTSTTVFAFVFLPFMGGITLEAPMYQAMLWPSALMGLAITTARITDDQPWHKARIARAAVFVLAVIAAGHWPGSMSYLVGLIVIVVIVAGTSASLVMTRSEMVAVGTLAVFLIGAQLLQNSRGPLGLYYLSPYSNAFDANPISDKVHAAVNTEDWLLAHTTRDDTILLWVDGNWVAGDRELYAVAGMQLWGENRITLEPTMTADDVTRLREIRPSVLALYGPSMDGILRFWSSIPGDLDPTAPTCYDFTWPIEQLPVGHACLTELHWPAA